VTVSKIVTKDCESFLQRNNLEVRFRRNSSAKLSVDLVLDSNLAKNRENFSLPLRETKLKLPPLALARPHEHIVSFHSLGLYSHAFRSRRYSEYRSSGSTTFYAVATATGSSIGWLLIKSPTTCSRAAYFSRPTGIFGSVKETIRRTAAGQS
jgi:hypothetical protein